MTLNGDQLKNNKYFRNLMVINDSGMTVNDKK